jgi:SAM-dependent methyltransferase
VNARELLDFCGNTRAAEIVESAWRIVGEGFRVAHKALPSDRRMVREELSFHDDVRLLGYLCLLISQNEGDVVEIGIWKGKSLAFTSALVGGSRQVIGVDPLELPLQLDEVLALRTHLFPDATIVRAYSEHALNDVLSISRRFVLVHIDGGHTARNVVLDFLLYSPFVVPGGFIVFDDYGDFNSSPEVGPAVDLLRAGGFFEGYNVIGPVGGFENSYVLRKYS